MSSFPRVARVAVVVVLVVVACAVGWWAGSAEAACRGRQDCFIDVPLFGALGTWAAGLGTVAALIFAGLQLAGDQKERALTAFREEQAKRERFQDAFAAAQRVLINVSASTWNGDICREVQMTVTNRTHEDDIFDVSGDFEYGTLRVERQLAPGGHHFCRRSWDTPPGPEVKDRTAWLEELTRGATIEFKLGEWTWARRGGEPAQLKPGG